MNIETFAHRLYPKKGSCKSSPFANGWHRVGSVPTLSILDGGMAGDVLNEICLECGKDFGNRFFLPINQPNSL